MLGSWVVDTQTVGLGVATTSRARTWTLVLSGHLAVDLALDGGGFRRVH